MPPTAKSKVFSVRLSIDAFEWLDIYLDKYSFGESKAEKFNNMILEMKRLEHNNITFVNLETALKQTYENLQKQLAIERSQEPIEVDEIKERVAQTILQNKPSTDICVRFPIVFSGNKEEIKTAMCLRCGKMHTREYNICQRLKEGKKQDEPTQN